MTSLDVNAVVVVGAERVVALGALALSRLVARLETLEAEDVEALCQDGVLLLNLARRTRQLLLLRDAEMNELPSMH